MWDRFGVFMRVRQPEDVDPDRKSQLPGISLALFGAGDDMKIRLREMVEHEGWEGILKDPYILFDVILDELYLQMDRNVQDVSRLFGHVESVRSPCPNPHLC